MKELNNKPRVPLNHTFRTFSRFFNGPFLFKHTLSPKATFPFLRNFKRTYLRDFRYQCCRLKMAHSRKNWNTLSQTLFNGLYDEWFPMNCNNIFSVYTIGNLRYNLIYANSVLNAGFFMQETPLRYSSYGIYHRYFKGQSKKPKFRPF
jgi:hypothetical protein